MRTRTLLLLATTLTLATIAGIGVAAGGAAAPDVAPRDPDPAPSALARASRVLGAWDRARAAAWARGDAAALADLYTRSSATGAHDVADLRRWRHRGLRVVGLRQQVSELRVLVARPRHLVVRATDRTVDGIAVGARRRTALPVTTWRSHRIRILLRQGHWVVDEAQAEPASTDFRLLRATSWGAGCVTDARKTPVCRSRRRLAIAPTW